jgi:hypothetical protein
MLARTPVSNAASIRHTRHLGVPFWMLLAVGAALSLAGCDRTPSVHGVAPEEIPETGAVEVTVSGEGFGSRTRVTLNGSVLPDTTVVDRTTLRVVLPPAAPGTARIGAVTLPDVPSPTTVQVRYLDVTPPKVIGWQPAGALPPDATTNRILVTFSEPVAAASIDLHDDQGTPVSGTVSYSGTVVAFAPSKALSPGRGYVVSVHGVQDARGNSAPAGRLRFSIGAPE